MDSKYEVDMRQQKVPNLRLERFGTSDISSFSQLMTTKREERTVNFQMDAVKPEIKRSGTFKMLPNNFTFVPHYKPAILTIQT